MSPYQSKPKSVWPGVLENIPTVFAAALEEPAFSIDDTTFAIWRQHNDQVWHCGNIDFPADPYGDGSADLLTILDGRSETYLEWANDYYEADIDHRSIQHVYQSLPLSNSIVRSLNPEASIKVLETRLEKIGYPLKS